MNKKLVEILKSYLRGVLVAITPLLATQNTDKTAYCMAVVSGFIAPLIRSLDKSDPAFGLVADAVVAEADKVAKKSAKKTA